MKINAIVLCLISFSFGCSPSSENKPDIGASDSGKISDFGSDSGRVSDIGSDSGMVSDSVSDVEILPENCQQYDGDKNGCIQAGCNVYNEGPIWCVKQGECLTDKQTAGFCDHVPDATMNGISSPSFRADLGIAILFGKKTAGLTDWETCPEDETGTLECVCLQQTGFDAIEGECL